MKLSFILKLISDDMMTFGEMTQKFVSYMDEKCTDPEQGRLVLVYMRQILAATVNAYSSLTNLHMDSDTDELFEVVRETEHLKNKIGVLIDSFYKTKVAKKLEDTL